MQNTEKIKEIFERYYQRDEMTRKAKKEFEQQNGSYYMAEILDSIPELEERFGVTLPENYKAFLEAGAGIGMSTMDNCDKFYAFDKRVMLDWNIMGDVEANVSDTFEDLFVFGADYCDYCYFIDVKNKFRLGNETVWRSYRSKAREEDIQLVGNNFIEFLENFANNDKLVTTKPLAPYKPTVEDGEAIIKLVEERARADEKVYQEILEAEKKIDGYIEEAKKLYEIDKSRMKRVTFVKTHSEDYGYMGLEPFKSKYFDNFPVKSLAILVYLGLFTIKNSYGWFSVNREMNEFINDRNFRNPELSEYLRFFKNSTSVLKNREWDLIIQDYQNKLDRGPDAIYIICDDGSPIEEACYVAKDIVEFIRKICEDEPLDLTPIGKVN